MERPIDITDLMMEAQERAINYGMEFAECWVSVIPKEDYDKFYLHIESGVIPLSPSNFLFYYYCLPCIKEPI